MTNIQYCELCKILDKKPTDKELKEMSFTAVDGIFDQAVDYDIGLYKFEQFKDKRREKPMANYKIITLCGSTKFKEDFERVNKELTLKGNIVISVACFGHSGDIFTGEQKIMLDDIHKRKIDLADAIYVINKNGYIGSSTKSEIEYAKQHGKEILYMESQQ